MGIIPMFVDLMHKTSAQPVNNSFPAQYKIWFIIKII